MRIPLRCAKSTAWASRWNSAASTTNTSASSALTSRKGRTTKLAYQNNSLIAWYTGTWGIAETSQNVSGTRYIYDAMHDFFSGIPTEMEKPVKNLAAAGTLTLEAEK